MSCLPLLSVRGSSCVVNSSRRARHLVRSSRYMSGGGGDGPNRNYYVSGASNPTGITEEIRDLVKNQRTAFNVDEWRIGAGIGQPKRLDNAVDEDIDDDQMPEVVYWPHKGDDFHERSEGYTPSPVLLVKRTKKLGGEPYWHKDTCERLGIGQKSNAQRVVAVPNTPSMLTRLYTIKHLVEIIPVTFPNGFPSDEEFDPSACRINQKGEFYHHPELKQGQASLAEPAAQMKISKEQIVKEARSHWEKPWNSPMGNSNYHRVTGYQHNDKFDHATDPTYKKHYSK